MIRANVEFRQDWADDLVAEVNGVVRDAVGQASKVGAEATSQLASPRRRRGVMAQVEAVPVVGITDGWSGGFRSKAGQNGEFYSGYQSRGTLGARTKKVKAETLRRRETKSGSARYAKVSGRKGITALKHEERGLAVARRHLVDLLNRLL